MLPVSEYLLARFETAEIDGIAATMPDQIQETARPHERAIY